MTIARRLVLLVTIPLVAFVGLGFLVRVQITRLESLSRFVVDVQVQSIAALGNILRSFEETRLSLRTFLLTTDDAGRREALSVLRERQAELNRLVARYADTLISDAEDRRMCLQFQDLVRQWSTETEKLIRLSAEGRDEEAKSGLLSGAMADMALRGPTTLQEWIRYNERLATTAGAAALSAIQEARRNLLIALSTAMALSAILGFVTFRRIVHPIRGLQTSIEAIASGDYVHPVPFTGATDETGALARSIDVLKAGAATMAEQRWVKANIAKLTAALQTALSHDQFGQHLLSGLVPVLGGGVAGFYLRCKKARNRCGSRQATGLARRISRSLPFPEARRGDGRPVRGGTHGHPSHQSSPGLPADILRTGRGLASPGHRVAGNGAGPVTGRAPEFASFRCINTAEQSLMEELLADCSSMSLEVLLAQPRDTGTAAAQTQEQAPPAFEIQNESASRRARYERDALGHRRSPGQHRRTSRA